MGKLIVLFCFALLAMTLVMACGGPGLACTSDADCCGSFVCNYWAKKCTGGPGIWGPGGRAGGPWGPGGPVITEVEWPAKAEAAEAAEAE